MTKKNVGENIEHQQSMKSECALPENDAFGMNEFEKKEHRTRMNRGKSVANFE